MDIHTIYAYTVPIISPDDVSEVALLLPSLFPKNVLIRLQVLSADVSAPAPPRQRDLPVAFPDEQLGQQLGIIYHERQEEASKEYLINRSIPRPLCKVNKKNGKHSRRPQQDCRSLQEL